MYILGISAMSHDSTAALLDESGIVAAIEEGKLTRNRTIGGIPRAAIQFCFERAGITWRDLGHIAVGSKPSRAFQRQAGYRVRLAPRTPVSSSYFLNKASGELGRELNNLRILKQMAGGGPDRVNPLDHHFCHAASAFYPSPFERALIVSMDEQGDGRAVLIAMGEGTRIRELDSIRFPHSLAWIYSQFTQLLGFRSHSEEHKTQWLSLAGEPEFAGVLIDMLRQKPDGPPHLNPKYFRRSFAGELCFTKDFYRRIGTAAPAKREAAPVFADGKRANIAASLQKAAGTILCDWLSALRVKTKEKSLCLAGGLFLNPLLVSEIEARAGFENVFVQPAAGNEGTALGAAWIAWHQALGRPRNASVASPLWGPAYTNAQIKLVLDNCKATYRWLDTDDLKLAETVRLLQLGKIVAFFQGATEFGPRALGNRSLLASPWAPYVKENLNDFVKHRESFRPFALAIPEEDSADFFEASPNARFLTTMAKANEKGRKLLEALPEGFLLRDDLVRLQVVRESDNPLFWKLLKRSGENAPAPILVNTSFNLFGEPLVVTPRDAIRSYFCSGTDALVAGNFLLGKR
jgi:carbamoyltransferase